MENAECPRILTLSATGQAREGWSVHPGDYSLTEEEHRGRPVYIDQWYKRYLYSLEDGGWAVSISVGHSEPVIRSTSPTPCPALCQHWEYWDWDKYKPGDVKVTFE